MAARDQRKLISAPGPDALAATAAGWLLERTGANSGRFIGDERLVQSDGPLHDMGNGRQFFLDQCAPCVNIRPIPTDGASAHDDACRHERELTSFSAAGRLDPAKPLFDLVPMELRPNGHIPSLRPRLSPGVEDRMCWADAPVAPRVSRITLTFPALCSCREMPFEVAGPDKRTLLTRVLAGANPPASRAHLTGETVLPTDEGARPEDVGGQ